MEGSLHPKANEILNNLGASNTEIKIKCPI